MKILLLTILALYTITTLIVFLYTIMQCHLTVAYIRHKFFNKKIISPIITFVPTEIVTVQLPVYNEPFVVKRLIQATCALIYPKHLLHIQVLDDSTDNTVDIVNDQVKYYQLQGYNIQAVRRSERVGYKAGALKYGLQFAQGEYIAVFDSDFIPNPNFLTATMPLLLQPNIGMVQTCWGHTNRNYSLITKAQAFWLENHFKIEQTSRSNLNLFFNFNGTAGIWKKEAILSAGNWQADTLTEDLDLSYRAQAKGWQFLYVEDLVSPAELPPTLQAFKSQQYRWTKGGAEVSRKMLGTVLNLKIPLTQKLHAAGHLLNSSVYLAIAISALLSVPLLAIKSQLPQMQAYMAIGILFFSNFIILAVTYFVATWQYYKINGGVFAFLKTMQVYLSLSSAMSFHNSKAVLQGYFGYATPFVRTPKYNTESQGIIAIKQYANKFGWQSFISNSCLFILFLLAAVYGIATINYGFILFHATLAFGLGLLLFFQISDATGAK